MAQRWAQFANGYRIRTGNVVALVAMPYQTGFVAAGGVRVVYDDGTEDDLLFTGAPSTTAGTTSLSVTKQAAKDGWVVGGSVGLNGSGGFSVRGYGQLLILADVNANRTIQCLGNGFIGAFQVVTVGQFQGDDFQATWVFQGTVLEDATAGTHVSTLTVVPGAGNELWVVGGNIQVGAGATAQTATAWVDDGSASDVLYYLLNANQVSATLGGLVYSLPSVSTTAAVGSSSEEQATGFQAFVSGTMRLVLQVSTTAVSVTERFGLVCRLKGAPPTTTLADSVGTPVLTTNTNAVFG